jgi:flagellar basal body L-ring protein FlgH
MQSDLHETPAYAEPPTAGGSWPEGQMISGGGMPSRGLASVSEGGPDQSKRDLYGGSVSFAQRPDVEPETERQYRPINRLRKEDFVDIGPSEGSLWASEGQTNYFFIKNKIKDVGDIVTLTVDEGVAKNTVAEVKKSLTPEEIRSELKLIQDKYDQEFEAQKLAYENAIKEREAAEKAAKERARTEKETTKPPETAAGQKPNEVAQNEAPKEAPKESAKLAAPAEPVHKRAQWQDIDLAGLVPIKAGDTMTGEVVERFGNGNYRVRATKKIPFRDGHRLVSIVGVAKANDISEDDKLNAGKLYEYELKTFH